jgi:ribonuclease HI
MAPDRPSELYVAVSARPPRSAWSWRIVRHPGGFVDGTGTEAGASANRLRLHALVEGLRQLGDGEAVQVVTTDANTIRMAEDWIPRWQADGWDRGRGRRIENRDLVMDLAHEIGRLQVAWRHEPRRTGDPHAKDCKRHAVAAADAMTEDDLTIEPMRVEVPSDVPVVAWTDGGALVNPGPAAWGFVLVHLASGTTLQARGGENPATNNRMELTAILKVLETLQRPTRLELRMDSRFAISVCTEWRRGWKRRGWRKGDGEPPANLDVIQALDAVLDQHDVRFVWVPGHAGEPGNERADALCNEAIDAIQAGQDPAWEERSDTPPFELN